MAEIKQGENEEVLLLSSAEIDAVSADVLTEIFDHLSESVVVADTNRQIVYVNSAAEKLFGYTRQELYGKETKMLYARESDFSEQGEKRFNTASKINAENYRISYRRSDGVNFLGLTTAAPMRNTKGVIVGFIGIVRPGRSLDQSLDSLQKIHAIASDTLLADTEKVEALLSIGLEHFGMEMAIQSRINGTEYLVENCIDLNAALEPGAVFDLSGTYCSHALNADGPIGFHFAGQSNIQTHPCYREFKLESYIGCPIKINGKLYGTVNFSRFDPTEPFSRDDYILIDLLADTLSYLFYKKQAREELLALARTDELTGLANRRATLERLREHINLSHRTGAELSLLCIDLDYFKEINDKWGHSAGDAALRGFAHIVSQQGRKTDFCGRIGGEEFVLVFPHTGAKAGLKIGNRLRELLRESPVDLGAGASVCLSMSAGLACLQKDETLESLLSRADKAMYQAKQQGRNRVHISEPD